VNGLLSLQLAWVEISPSVAVGSIAGDVAVAVSRSEMSFGAPQRTGTPWPPLAASSPRAPGGGRVAVRNASRRLLA
jgi:hypothetical protein